MFQGVLRIDDRRYKIRSEASFGNEGGTINDLSQINFFYGSNGSGKTTISRVIANEDKYPECSITWRGGNTLETLVYNRDFVERNFNADAELRGIFTLGEENEAHHQAIEIRQMASGGCQGTRAQPDSGENLGRLACRAGPGTSGRPAQGAGSGQAGPGSETVR